MKDWKDSDYSLVYSNSLGEKVSYFGWDPEPDDSAEKA